jgi:hypothetical protein
MRKAPPPRDNKATLELAKGGAAGRYDDGGEVEDGPPDLTDQYNTRLSPDQETAFQRTPYARDVYDYDARGEFLAGQNRDNPTGHGTDTFKKPNHPTFSTNSRYHGADGHEGGVWTEMEGGRWRFTPSPTNLRMTRPEALRRYFQEREQGNELVLPQQARGGIVGYDEGGEVGGIAPSNATANPQTQGMIQRYSSMPQEKLAQLAVMMGGSPQGRVIQQILAQKRTQPQEQSRGGVTRRAIGGQMSMPQWSRTQQAQEVSGRGASGYLHGSTPGRADAILTTAPGGSHVVPSDVLGGLGEGNSAAGAKIMERLLRSGPHGVAMPKSGRGMGMPRAPAPYREVATGGDVDDDDNQTPVALSHGEFVVSPEQVRAIGGGDLKLGHKILDDWIVAMRKQIIAMMKALPGPVRSKS